MGNATNKTSDNSVPPHILNLHNAARVHDVRGLKNAIAQFLVHETSTRPPVRLFFFRPTIERISHQIQSQPIEEAIDSADNTGKTALHLACMSRDNTEGRRLRTVVELIRLGASLNRKDYRGFTALHHAATTGDRALIEALLSKGAKAERDIFGLQPVDVCSLLTTLLVSIHLKFRTHKRYFRSVRIISLSDINSRHRIVDIK